MADKPRTLIISSVDPTKGTGTVALNFYNALRKGGFEVDFLTKYPVPAHPEFLHVFPEKMGRILTGINQKSVDMGLYLGQQGNHAFDYGRENEPPVPTWLVTRKIRKRYDVVYIVFWYQLLSYQTIRAIYRKLHCQIHLRCPDNQPIAGGCHFIGACPRVAAGCGQCPGLGPQAPEDFTAFNIEYRRKALKKVKPIIYGNTHMQMIYRNTALLKDYPRLETVYPLVDNAFFHPLDQTEAGRSLGIDVQGRFVLFFGCTILDEERKGMRHLIHALELFRDTLSPQEHSRVLLILAGNHTESIQPLLPFESQALGYIPFDKLPAAYAAADAFLCPSTDDAGPSMVNQSLSCGTPVVAFSIGTALDMVKGHDTGYCAALCDDEDFAHGINLIYRSSPEQAAQRRAACRNIALSKTSEEGFLRGFMEVYQRYRKKSLSLRV